MKKIIIVINIFLLSQVNFTQGIINPSENNILDQSIDNILNGRNNRTYIQDVGAEFLGGKDIIAPLIPPARSRQIPGTEQLIIPVEETDGPLNLSPNDTKAYIVYNRATIAFRNQQYETARVLYRDLIRQYPESSYTPYALYVLSISETDYRRKIRILLTIKERFPNFVHRELILDRLGDIYYLLDSPDAAVEVLKLSKSSYALYLRAMIALDAQKPNQAINLIKEFLKKGPNNEAAYQAYMLYTEALISIRGYKNALIVLEKAVELRPWAYDNGGLILLHAGKSFYNLKQYREALYVFSLLRLRFSRSTESRMADQYLVSLNKQNVVSMQSVPWIAESFETTIKAQPVVSLRTPEGPSINDIMQMNSLPSSSVSEPSLEGIAFLPPMPVPVQASNQYSLLVPLSDIGPKIELVTLTNMLVQEYTNQTEKVITNRVFVVETNTLTNNYTFVNREFLTNIQTNVMRVWETNTVVSYEPVVLWRTNYANINITNLITNIIDHVVTNEKIELLPLWRTNYNFINRPRDITNEIYRDITNKYLEFGINGETNWRMDVVKKKFIEIVPSWKSTYQSIDTNELVTNVLISIVTNQRLELVPRWIDNVRTNDTYKLMDNIITNTRLRIAPRWITNFQIIQTNMRDAVITNTVNAVKTNVTEQVITNLINITHNKTNVITNVTETELTNFININRYITNVITNIAELVVTNRINRAFDKTNVITNIAELVVTNRINRVFDKTNVITNIAETIITNIWDKPFDKTNVVTNITESFVTNLINMPKGGLNIVTNITESFVTNLINMPNGGLNVATNLTENVITNLINMPNGGLNIVTNLTENVVTNLINMPNGGLNIATNITEQFLTNIYTNASTLVEVAPVETVISTISPSTEDDVQIDFILEPIYANAIEEPQIQYVSPEIARLEYQVAKFAEQSAGVAGQYGFSENKGFVIRIAQVKDLSVANIILRDINELQLDAAIGIYYKEELYFLEIRSIKDKKKAEKLSQELYQQGYIDIQMFEQYEVVEYQDN